MAIGGQRLWQDSSRKAPFGRNQPAERGRRVVGQFEFPLVAESGRAVSGREEAKADF
jgi:hypothetical protein